jgi:2-phospho-L-lactate guanylyltransferase
VTAVVVPAKSFARAKSRLAQALDPRARAALAQSLFEHVLDVSTACARVSGVLVVTDGDDVESIALSRGLACVRDAGEPPLSVAVDLGLRAVRDAIVPAAPRGGAGFGSGAPIESGVLVLMADLPWLTTADVASLVAALDHADLVAGPDEPRLGTNALALGPGVELATAFGRADSFAQHLAIARAKRLRVAVHESPGVALDIDTPADLRAMDAFSERRRARTGSASRA